MKTQNKLKYLCGIVMTGIMAVSAGCGFFDESASITVSVDADSLRKFVKENISSDVIKGNFEANQNDVLSLRVTLTGDENGEYTTGIPHAPLYSSTVSVKIEGLRVGAKVKVRVDLMQDKKIIITGGTKSFAVSAGGNNVAVPMGNYSDIIVWNQPNGVYYRGEIEMGAENDFIPIETDPISWSSKDLAFDSGNNSLYILYTIDYTKNLYPTSWRQHRFTSCETDIFYMFDPVMAVYNSFIYYCKGGSDNVIDIVYKPTSATAYSLSSGSSDIMVTALALNEDGKKAYAAYTVAVDQSLNKYDYYIMSFDVSNGSWTTSSKIQVARSGNFLGSDINYKKIGVDGFLTNGFKITDIKVQDGYVWVLVREGQGDNSTHGISRGALIRYNTSLGARKVFGWTADDRTAQASANPYYPYHYRVPPHPDNTNFFGPIKFVGSRPGELVIADDGYFMGISALKRDINRIIFFDTEKESVSTVHSLNSSLFGFDYSYGNGFGEVNKPDKNPLAFEGGDGFKMKPVNGGTFMLQSGGPNMTVSSFLMAETEVTQELWAAVMAGTGNNIDPSVFSLAKGKGTDLGEIAEKRPVESITWYDTIEFCNKLSELNGKEKVYTINNISRDADGYIYSADVTADFTKNGYRLPTEMEWMWAAMGEENAYAKQYAGHNIVVDPGGDKLGLYAWCNSNSETNSKTHEVGRLEPNELGLGDMSGNVWEWCWDWWQNVYPTVDSLNYTGPSSGGQRIVRGGSYGDGDSSCTVASRSSYLPGGIRSSNIGFRVVRSAD